MVYTRRSSWEGIRVTAPGPAALLLLLLCVCPVAMAQVMFFNDTQSAYAKMDAWTVGQNQVSFSFRTRLQQGLLWRATSSVSRLELRLHEGHILCVATMLNSNVSDASSFSAIMMGPDIPHSLTDGLLHSLTLRRMPANGDVDMDLTLTVDSAHTETRTWSSAWHTSSVAHDIFLAGLPVVGQNVSRFIGCIQEYRHADEQPALLASSAMSRMPSCPVCVDDVTCRSDGRVARCPADGVSACRCAGTGLQGPTCQQAAPVAALLGTACLQFQLEPLSQARVAQTFSIRFRSNRAGTLMHTDHFKLSLADGSVSLTLTQATAAQASNVSVGDGLLASGVEWHNVEVIFSLDSVSLVLDSYVRKTLSLNANREVASQIHPYTTTVHVGCNRRSGEKMIGCIQDAYAGNTNLITVYQEGPSSQEAARIQVTASGFIVKRCPPPTGFPANRAVTFHHGKMVDFHLDTEPDTLVHSVHFWFRTNEASAHLLSCRYAAVQISISLGCGGVVVLLRNDTMTTKRVISLPKTNKVEWHRMAMKLLKPQCKIRLTIDQHTEFIAMDTREFCEKTGDGLSDITLGSSADGRHTNRHYSGCMGLAGVNNHLLPFVDQVRGSSAFARGTLSQGCSGPGPGCSGHTCSSVATCVPGWQRYHCDCSQAPFTGKNCTEATPVVSFHGHTLQADAQEPLHRDTELGSCTANTCPLVLFSAHVKPHQLTATSTLFSSLTLALQIREGRLYLLATKRDGHTVMIPDGGVALPVADQWFRVRVWVDCQINMAVGNITVSSNVSMKSLHLLPANVAFSIGGEEPGTKIQGSSTAQPGVVPFVGCMQKIHVNGHEFIVDRTAPGVHVGSKCRRVPQCAGGAESTVTFPKFSRMHSHPLQPALRYALPWKTLATHSIHLGFKTHQHHGVLFASGMGGKIQVQVTLHMSKLCLRVKLPAFRSFHDNCTRNKYANGKWFSVDLHATAAGSLLEVLVGKERLSASLDEALSTQLEMIEETLVIGNTQCASLDTPVDSLAHGYIGCVRHVALGGKCVDNLIAASQCSMVPTVIADPTAKGLSRLGNSLVHQCSADANFCSLSPCMHEGKCSSAEGGPGRYCDCRTTGHVGETCSKVASVATFNTTSSSLGVLIDKPLPLSSLYLKVKPGQLAEDGRGHLVEIAAITDGKHGMWVYSTLQNRGVEVLVRTADDSGMVICKVEPGSKKGVYRAVNITLHTQDVTMVTVQVDQMSKTCRLLGKSFLNVTRMQMGRLPVPLRQSDSAVGFRGWMKEVYVNHDFRPLEILAAATTEDKLVQKRHGVQIKPEQVALGEVSLPSQWTDCSQDDEDCTIGPGSGSGSTSPPGPVEQGKPTTQPSAPKPTTVEVRSATKRCETVGSDGTCQDDGDGGVGLGEQESSGGVGSGATIGIIIVSVVVGIVIGVITVFVLAKLVSSKRGQFKLDSTSSMPSSKSPDGKFSVSSGEHFL